MFLSLVIIFCIASVHCSKSANSSQKFESSDGGASTEPELPLRGCKEAPPFVESCADATECGVYSMMIAGVLREVYCEVIGKMRFIVVQRRGDFGDREDYFSRGWLAYQLGFGDPRRQIWLGNDALNALTKYPKELYIDMEDFEGLKTTVIVQGFQVFDGNSDYQLSAPQADPDKMGMSFVFHNNIRFSTKDNDNTGLNCASKNKGGWWYSTCGYTNLNGLYLKSQNSSKSGIFYHKFRGFRYSLKSTVMKILVESDSIDN